MTARITPLRPVALLKRWWSRRFYNRLLFLGAVIFIVVVYSFGIYAAILATTLNINSQLQRGREVLSSICDEYDRKHDNFYNVILPLYNSAENYNILSSILEGEHPDLVNSPQFKLRVVTLCKSIVMQDKDIVAVLLHCNTTGEDYLYNDPQSSFGAAPKGFPFFNELKAKSPYGRAIYGVRNWGSAYRQQSTYGIASGSLGTRSMYSNAGIVMIAYNASGLNRVLQKFNMPDTARFYIVSRDGEVIFDSTSQFYGAQFPHMELLDARGTTVEVDGVRSFLQVNDHSNRQYYGLYVESDTALYGKINHDRLIIFGICTGVSVLSALLYLLAGLISTHRVRELEHAMSHIGSNNLSYRVPLRGTEDEFEHISIRFNRMCDELQDNVNRIYVHEIKRKNAELSALQSGIHPHFLYNTLEAIRSRAKEDGNDDVAELIVRMASLLRILVRSQTFIPIRQEVHFIRMYLDLFALRHADRFEYTVDVDEAALDCGVPKGILQPVVENYFVHGIREDADNNFLHISGHREEDRIVFEIEDNGRGIDPQRLAEIQSKLQAVDVSRTSYGLTNVHERLRLVYGQDCGLRVDSSAAGTTIRMTIRVMTDAQLRAGG